jgi:hypothetical protein
LPFVTRAPLLLLITAVLVPACAVAGPSPWSYTGELGASYDDNANNALDETQDASTLRASAGATYTHRIGLYAAVQARGALEGEASDPGGLSFVGAEARLRALAKPGQGFYVPVLAVWGAAGTRDFGSAIRDGNDYRVGAYLFEPLTTALHARLEASTARREADGRAFDVEEEAWAVQLDWAPAAWGTLYGEYRRKSGDIVISLEGGGIEPKSYHDQLEALAVAIEPDDAYGEDWHALRLDGARTTIVTLGLNVPLRADLSLDAQLLNADARVYGFGYERWIGGVSLLLRF